MAYHQSIRVRYGECDMQRVVFNANYFVYCDDVVDSWTRIALADELKAAGSSTDLHAIGFDFMLKNTNLTWHAPVRFGDTIDMTASVSRWGNSSFDVSINGSVAGETRFDAVITYVSIDPVSQRPAPVPDVVKAALER
ncbi:MAG: acyl-CoA thioesterase [Ilumatobacteraceae bacterium]|jgi:acyl-CoA thioester hydrolase|nr:acyl-CoA thioesterase [Ilumatobacteraceae bacterium]